MKGFTFHKHIKMSSLYVYVQVWYREMWQKGYVKRKIERVRGRESEKKYFVSECIIKLCVFKSKSDISNILPMFF